MLSIRAILDFIANTKSTTAKAAALAVHANNETLKEVFRLALSPAITFGLKSIPTDDELPKAEPYPANIDTALYQCRDVIASGVFGPNSAALKKYVADMLASLPRDDRDVIRRVLNKRLDIGIGKTEALKLWPGLWFQPEYMGAKSSSHLHRMTYPCVVQEKVSGSCVYVLYTPGIHDTATVTFYNPRRAGRTYNVQPELARAAGLLGRHISEIYGKGGPVTLCCEGLVADFGFDATMRRPITLSEADCNAVWSAAQKEAMPADVPAFLSIYDVRLHDVPEAQFYYPTGSKEHVSRLAALQCAFSDAFNTAAGRPSGLWLTMSWLAESDERASAIFRSIVEGGGEGTVRKACHGLWKEGKPITQVKEKNEETVTLKVVGTTSHTVEPGLVGALICTCEDKADFRVLVGTGLTDADRVRPDWVGRYIDVTVHKLSETGLSLKNPRLHRVRNDRDEADTYSQIVDIVTHGKGGAE